jgi:Flp pilus assembly protein TadG
MLKRAARSESGAILVFTALLLLVLVGFAALAVDLGNAWSTNRQSQNASDIGATSGLFAIPRTFSSPTYRAPRCRS